jgi:hypothetical protein
MKSLLKQWLFVGLLSLLGSGIVTQVVGPRALADSVTSTTLAGNFFSPVFGLSNDFFYVSQPFEEEVDGAGVGRSNFLKMRVSDLGIVSSTRVEFAIHKLAINSAGTYAYGTSSSGNRIAKINLMTLAVSEIQVTSLESISEFEIDSDGVYGYASGSKYNRTVSERSIDDWFVIKINLTTEAIAGTLPGFENVPMVGIALHEAQNFGCVVDNGQGTLQGFSISPFDWDSVPGCGLVSGLYPSQIEFDRSKTIGYVSVSGDKKLLKFNLSSGEVLKSVTFPNYTNVFRINPASTFAYVTDEEVVPSFLYKVSLSTFEIVEQIALTTSNRDIAISPNGQIGILQSGSLTKLNLSATAPQSISFAAPTSKLTGAKTVNLNASASSALPVSYSSSTQSVCTVSGAVVSLLDEGNCTIVASQNGSSLWDPAVSVARTFKVFLSPLSADSGISISAGKPYSNTKNVTIEIKWPEYADAVRLSNDGGFGTAVTQTKKLTTSIDWTLDDSVKGVYTKVVYARFTGEGIDTTKTYSDDIILDTNAPVVESSSLAESSEFIDLVLKATDDITGVDEVQIKYETKTVTKSFSAKVSVTRKEIGMSVSSSSVRKYGSSSIEVRISDRAGNWSDYQSLSLSASNKAPLVTMKKVATAKSIAAFAKLKIDSTSKVSLKVVASSAKFCRVSGASLKGLKTGSCKVTVTVKPKKGRAVSKTVTLKVTK